MAAPHRLAVPLFALLLVLASTTVHASAPDRPLPPVLRSTGRVLDVRDNGILRRGDWTADPAVALDEFVAGPARGPARVTFVSDLDSLTFEVAPGRPRDFVVQLADSTRCATRVTCLAGLVRTGGGSGPVEVPLRWSRNHKPVVRARVNGSKELDLLLDTGATDLTLYRSGVRKLGGIVTDGEVLNAGSGGAVVRRTRRSNTLELGPLRIEGLPLTVVESQQEPVDGIVGYRAFADRTIELDFERKVLVVHDSLPALPAAFTRLPLLWNGTLHAVPVRLRTARGTFDAALVVDTGLNGTFTLGAATSARLGLPEGVKASGWSKGKGLGAKGLRLQRLRFDALEIGGTALPKIPGFAVAATDTGARVGDLLGSEVLRRFRVFLDYRGNALVLAPNRDLRTPYRRGGGSGSGSGAAVVIAILVALGAGSNAARNRRPPEL